MTDISEKFSYFIGSKPIQWAMDVSEQWYMGGQVAKEASQELLEKGRMTVSKLAEISTRAYAEDQIGYACAMEAVGMTAPLAATASAAFTPISGALILASAAALGDYACSSIIDVTPELTSALMGNHQLGDLRPNVRNMQAKSIVASPKPISSRL